MKSLKIIFHILFILLAIQLLGQDKVTIENSQLKTLASLPKHVKEASGLEHSGNLFWTHNDGGLPVLFGIDSTGKIIRTLQIDHPNNGWEDLAQDLRGNFYIGAFGNNKNDKRALKIYKIKNPDSIATPVAAAEVINYRYADQVAYPPEDDKKNYDMDAMVAIGDSLYLFSKNRTAPFTGYTRIYSLPQQPGKYDARPIDSLYLGDGPMLKYCVTAADISPDGRTLALLGHQFLWLVCDFPGTQFSKGRLIEIHLNHFSHKAGVVFSDNGSLFIVDELEMEIVGGKLYRLDIDKILKRIP